jgi:hypothetical protein
MGFDGAATDSPVALARLVEELAATDAATALVALERLEAEIERFRSAAGGHGTADARVGDFHGLVASLQSTLREGRVRSLTGLERQVRFLTRTS